MITIEVPSITINLPTTIEEVSLKQRNDFASQYGFQLARKLAAVRGMKPGDDQDIELTSLEIETMFCKFSFFSGIDVQLLKDSKMDDAIAELYFLKLPELVEDLMNVACLSQYYSLS